MFDKSLIDKNDIADEVLKDILLTRRRKSDLEEVNDNETHWFCSKMYIKK